MQEFLPRHHTDKGPLSLLSLRLDALKRELNDVATPWKGDWRAWLEIKDGYFECQTRDKEAQHAFKAS